ncbi:hypothetical protein GUJ93_ZPchr0011g28764, partial [Zizania palustris]
MWHLQPRWCPSWQGLVVACVCAQLGVRLAGVTRLTGASGEGGEKRAAAAVKKSGGEGGNKTTGCPNGDASFLSFPFLHLHRPPPSRLSSRARPTARRSDDAGAAVMVVAPSAGAGGGGVGGGSLGLGEGSSSSAAAAVATIGPHGVDEETMWEINLGEAMEAGPYPERVGEPDCSYYMRTGLCRFGMTCKFNHPADRKMALAAARMKGEYPQRIGQPECQYYLKTGTCKFGATCKFHHPREKAAMATRVQLNALGYPLRVNEKECTYYLRTGQCKFGSTCKFHHPHPSNTMVA